MPMGTRLHTLQVDLTGRDIVATSAQLAPAEPEAFAGRAVAAVGTAVYVTGSWERDWTAHHELRCWDMRESQHPVASCVVEWQALEYPSALIAVRGRLYHAGNSLSLAGTNYLVNQALSVPAGSTLSLKGSWTNNSTITAAGATLVERLPTSDGSRLRVISASISVACAASASARAGRPVHASSSPR